MYQILIADDEPVARNSVREKLQVMLPGAALMTADNGAEAVELAAQKKVDIAFLDIRMPVLGGLEAADRIQKINPRCQIIFLTAYSDFSYTQQALRLGATDYVLKPFSLTSLSAVVQKAVNRIAFHMSAEQESQRIHKEARKLEQWFGDQFVLNVMNGYLSTDRIKEQLRKMGLVFESGAFAVLRCAETMSADRIRGMVRGCEWGTEIRLFEYEYDDCLYVLGIDSLTPRCAEQLICQLSRLLDKARRMLSRQLLCAVSASFSDLALAPLACSRCYTMLQDCTSECPLMTEQNGGAAYRTPNENAVFVDRMLTPLGDGNETAALDVLEGVFNHFRAQRLSLRACKTRICRYLEDVAQCAGLASAEWDAALQTGLQECADADAVNALSRRTLCALMRDTTGSRDMQEDRIRREIEAYIRDNYHRDILLPRIAQDMGYSETYFSRLFKKCFGQNFIAYLTSYRLEQAKILLADPLTGIRDVAQRVGYRDSGYFANVFRKTFGQTPSEYRAKRSENSGEQI